MRGRHIRARQTVRSGGIRDAVKSYRQAFDSFPGVKAAPRDEHHLRAAEWQRLWKRPVQL
jgi:hypothetical protein